MTYRVQPTAQAEADVDRIFLWLSERSHDGASRWYEAYSESAERLKTSPLSYALAPENEDFDEEVRHTLFGTRSGRTYRALFVVRDLFLRFITCRASHEQLDRAEHEA